MENIFMNGYTETAVDIKNKADCSLLVCGE